MNNYEGLFIVKPDLAEEEVKNVFKTIDDLIAKNSGAVKKDESWGKKELAYPVKKFKEGYYYKVEFTAQPGAIAKLEEAYKLNASILRTMITRR